MNDIDRGINRTIKARANILLEEVFFGSLAMKLKLVADPTAKKMWTDGVHVGVNPAWAAEADFDELVARLVEITMHNANGHVWRMVGLDPHDANIAADYAQWAMLKRAGYPLPDDVYYDQQYEGGSMESIYAKIHREPPPAPPKPQAPPKPPEGGSGGEQEPDSPSGQEPDGNEQHEQPQEPGSDGEIRPVPQEVDAEELETQWQNDVLIAAQAAAAQGKLPAGMERVIEKIKNPAIDWKSALRRFVQRCAKNDYSWRRPNRRFIAQGMYLPAVISENMPPIMVTIDTSGSIDQKQLDIFAAELTEIMAECKPERVHVLYVDAAVQRVDEFEAGDVLTFKPRGGGGTDMPKSWEWAEKNQIEPACALVFTDMLTPFGEEPEFPTMWVTPTRNRVAPYGETLLIEHDG